MEHPFLLSDESDVIYLPSNPPEDSIQEQPFHVRSVLCICNTISIITFMNREVTVYTVQRRRGEERMVMIALLNADLNFIISAPFIHTIEIRWIHSNQIMIQPTANSMIIVEIIFELPLVS